VCLLPKKCHKGLSWRWLIAYSSQKGSTKSMAGNNGKPITTLARIDMWFVLASVLDVSMILSCYTLLLSSDKAA